jgi:hypothetical protein
MPWGWALSVQGETDDGSEQESCVPGLRSGVCEGVWAGCVPQVLRMMAAGGLSGRMAKPVVAALVGGDEAALLTIVQRECGGAMVTDEAELRALCHTVRKQTEG